MEMGYIYKISNKAASAGSGVKEITIGAASRRKNNVACGFIWRRVTT
jgi:hypothetical protein